MAYRQWSSQIAAPGSHVHAPGAVPAADGWSAPLHNAVRSPGAVRPVFQPVVDLRSGGVRGYEMLARFVGPPQAPPDAWFAKAADYGLAIELEARMVRIGLEARSALPADCFLAINVDPDSLGDPLIQAAFAQHGRLHGVVIELTEHSRAADGEIEQWLPSLRERGATVAIDDVGSGYSGLQRIATLRPEFVKVDRSLVAGFHTDPARRELIESLGDLAARIDALVIAEGIEQVEELEALLELRVPFGQGFALARPEPGMVGPDVPLSEWLRERSPAADPTHLWQELAPLSLEAWEGEAAARLSADSDLQHLPVVDAAGHPVGLLDRARYLEGEGFDPEPLRALPDEGPAQLARRAMAREPRSRFAPLLCCDEQGRYLGIVEVERLVTALAEPRPAA